MDPNDLTEEQLMELAVQSLADYIGSHSTFTGTLTVDRSNETQVEEDKPEHG